MGLSSRKKSGKKIGGSSLIVVGQPIYSTKTFKPDFNKKRKPYEDFAEVSVNVSTTTTTTTIPIVI
jgi:hypothetical protein